MEEVELKMRFRSVLVSLSCLSFLLSLRLPWHIFTTFCHLFRDLSYFCVSSSSERTAFFCPSQRAGRQITVFLLLLLFVFSLSVSYVHRVGRGTHVSARPLLLAVDAVPRRQSNPALSKLSSALSRSHLRRAQHSATVSLLHMLPSKSAYSFFPLSRLFASLIQRRLREGAQRADVVSGAHTSRSRPPFFTPCSSDVWSRRFSVEADSLLLPGHSTTVLRASSPAAASLLLERNFSCRKLSRTSLSLSPTTSVSPSSPATSLSSSPVSGRSARVSIQVNRRRAPPADRPEPMELQVEPGAESPREELLKRRQYRLEEPSASDQSSSDSGNLAAADAEREPSLPDGASTEGTRASDPFWSPRAEEITDDMAFGIARNARYEQKLKMPSPLVPPNGSGFHREPVLPEHLLPHEVRCPPHWIAYGPHCVTLVTVPPWTTCPGDKSFRHHGLRSKMAVMSPGICAIVKETGVSLVCPKGYEPELTEFPAFKPKDLEDGSADSSEPLGRAFTCTQFDSIPLDIQSGKPCPLGYTVSEFGTCEGQKHVGPHVSCPLGFDLGGEQVNPYVIRGKEYAKCGAVEYFKGKNTYAGGFTEYSRRRNLQQSASPPGEGRSGIPDIYMKLQAKLPPGGGCAQVVAAFEAHCDKVECQTEYMQKMKTHIFNWLDYRLRSDIRQIDQLIPTGKDYRYTSPG